MPKFSSSDRALRADLKRALDSDGQLGLRYQPQVQLADGGLYGIEALARWRHPVLGDLPPDRFVPVAEAGGLIGRIGLWAVESGCRQLAAWQASGLDVASISVNLSPTQFHSPDLAEKIVAILARSGIAPEALMIEVTETVYLDGAGLRVLKQVHDTGVRLAIDDFGTGYSSLARLRDMPVDELKVDRQFLAGLEHDKRVRALMQAVVGIGDSLGLAVVVEGVETEGQAQFLASCGCMAAQGYLYAEPMEAEGFERWLRERSGRRLSPASLQTRV